jgi:hypothetical protein
MPPSAPPGRAGPEQGEPVGSNDSTQVQGTGINAPIPQYWLADAALFTGNAANAANVLALEHNLSVPAPALLGNQAQFLVSSTNRALASLKALQQSAETTKPSAVPQIREAVGQIMAAQGAATQVADAASSGVVGPAFEATTRAASQHLAAAEKSIAGIGRSYNAPALASAGSCPMRGAFGAGLGPSRKAPPQSTPPSAPQSTPPSAPQSTPPATPAQP